MQTHHTVKAALAVVGPLVGAFVTSNASAQWVGIQHDTELRLDYVYTFANTTLEDEFAITGVPTHQQLWTLAGEYVPWDFLAVRLGFELYTGKYSGPKNGPTPRIVYAHGSYDDGDTHFTTADAYLEVAYMALESPVALTPLIRAVHPTRDYETSGYAAAGLGLRAIGAGIEIGTAELGVDGLFARGRYVFMYVESEDAGGELTSSINLHRSEAEYGIGYSLEPKIEIPLVISLGGAFRFTHGGVQLVDAAVTSSPLFPYHDVIRQQKYLTVGGSIGYAVTSSVGVAIATQAVVWGDNVAAARSLMASVSWTDNILDLIDR